MRLAQNACEFSDDHDHDDLSLSNHKAKCNHQKRLTSSTVSKNVGQILLYFFSAVLKKFKECT